MNIAKNDTVEVITGADKGLKGKVLKIFPKTQRVIVEKVNLRKRHRKARRQNEPGGIIEQEAPIHVSNVRILERGSR